MSFVEYQLVERHELLRSADEEVLLKIAALADFDQAVDQLFLALQARGEAERLHELCPFFGNLWPAARGLARFLARRGREGLAEMRVLEVGCGLALPGLAAAWFGAEVTVTDGHPDVPSFLARNKQLNGLERVRYRSVDWRVDLGSSLLGVFDLIIGSDVLYDRDHPELLATFVQAHAAPGSEIIIADPGRAYLQNFQQLMAERGFAAAVDVEDEIFILTFRHHH